MARRGGLLDHSCVLLSALVHHVDRGVDLLQSRGLFARGFDKRIDMTAYFPDLVDDGVE